MISSVWFKAAKKTLLRNLCILNSLNLQPYLCTFSFKSKIIIVKKTIIDGRCAAIAPTISSIITPFVRRSWIWTICCTPKPLIVYSWHNWTVFITVIAISTLIITASWKLTLRNDSLTIKHSTSNKGICYTHLYHSNYHILFLCIHTPLSWCLELTNNNPNRPLPNSTTCSCNHEIRIHLDIFYFL